MGTRDPSTSAKVLHLVLVTHHYYGSNLETAGCVADPLVLRWFYRVYLSPVPNGTTLLHWAHTLQHSTLQALYDRVVRLAREAHVTTGRNLRIDGSAVQTTIHHATHSILLIASVRVLSQLVRRSKN